MTRTIEVLPDREGTTTVLPRTVYEELLRDQKRVDWVLNPKTKNNPMILVMGELAALSDAFIRGGKGPDPIWDRVSWDRAMERNP